MLFPIGHEDLRGRRWPVITIVIIALNVVVFLGTHWKMDEENSKIAQATWDTVQLAATHPDVQLTPSQQKIVDVFRRRYPAVIDDIKSEKGDVESGLDEEQKAAVAEQAQIAATDLGKQLDELERDSIVKNYEYYPDNTNAISLITASFLHAGWLHLIGNMWFLWLAGTVLEDAWGRPIYAVFYLVAGVVALLVQGAAMQHSIGGVLGASGAIAGAMGAFLVRFPKTRIKFLFTLFFGFRFLRWKFLAPAYAMLPLWLGEQVLSAFVPGMGGVAYWAHIGGFGFGMIVAVALKYSGVEHNVNQTIEAKVSWSADPRVEKANEALDQNQIDVAIGLLNSLVAEQPESVEAHTTLLQAYLRKQDSVSAQGEAAALCKINLKAREMDLAFGNYEEYTNIGGTKFPSTEWMALCRHLEGKQNWQRAAAEYEKIATAYKGEKPSVYALISAGRINLKQLGNTAEASRLYREVQNSPVPHHEWEDAIRKGLSECGAEASAPVMAGASPIAKPN
jgi:membrane associated rhomboid family serine protease